MNNWKKIGIGVAVAALTLITCYAAFAQQLVQNPSTIMSNQKGIWDIGFVDAKLKNLTGQATIISDVKYNKLFGTFSVGIAEKNDSATYDFTIKNEGKLDAVVDNIYIIPSNKPYDLVLFSATGLKRGDVLNVGDTSHLYVTALFNTKYNGAPLGYQKNVKVIINYRQKLK